MVAKINIGSNLYGALAYNQEKVDEGVGKVLGTNLVFEPADGRFNVADCMSDFMQFVPSHFRTEKPVFHVSINPHPDDRLTDDQLTDIGREYMDKLGYGDQPYVIFKHEDIGREHLHIVSLRVNSNGKKINDYREHERSKEITEYLEHKYSLNPTEGQKRTEQWELTPVDASKGDLKKQIASVIKPLASMYHFQSMGEYKALLSLYNIHLEELKGEVKGKPYRGLLYSATDNLGNKTGTPLKSSIFGKSVGYDGLEKRMKKSAERIKTNNLKTHTLKVVSEAKQDGQSESEFRAKLRLQGIDVLFRRNDEGRIYGATFIDHTTRTVLNGSRLGKEYSANVFNELYGGKQEQAQETIPNINLSDVYDNVQPTEKYEDNHSVHNVTGGLFSILDPEPVNHPEEEMPLPRRKKKKKRRYGRQM
ncbi:MAG: relaxase/mobilization nuclease domain-containing protein [Bacteroidales bacterium]|uniref:conjugal transfer protein MobB n=1 Tax=Bacteroides graminisolvens TaxID=477666 RepID=UPI0016B6251B|nr:conjugal transfer protein MobB [Bacteroides graminisolvens]NLC86379.1 relaxase/mobilization nuclease domain-containing protein [Bacteroidales bacterium]